ncbi:MAG: hypothetical protein R2724_31615 [Bryobacterales bacterium]
MDPVRCTIGVIVILLLPAIPILAFWILPFLPIGLLPPYGRSWQASDMFPRLFVASLAATQPLQVYPVAGSQIGIAASPLILGPYCVFTTELAQRLKWPATAWAETLGPSPDTRCLAAS